MSRRQADEVGWSQKVTEMGQGTDKDEKGKKGGRTMTVMLLICHVDCGSITLLAKVTPNP